MSKVSSTFTLTNTTKGKLPSLPFVRIKDAIVGKNYELSLVFVGDIRSRKLNKVYRGKDKPTNVLSFSINPHEGEIYINPKKARVELKKFDRTFKKMIGYLLIHGLLHLKGFEHSSKMESEEQRFCKVFSL